MSAQNPLAVVGYGMWTAAGHDGPSSVAAMRAGVAGSVETQLWDPTAGAVLNGFPVSAHQWWEGESFLAEMAAEVIRQCRDQIAGDGLADPAQVPILIAVAPKDRPARSEQLEQILMTELCNRLGAELPPGSGILAGGRCGVTDLMRNAHAQIAAYPVQIIIGVESFLRKPIIQHYINAGRLLCAANSSGFIPGEAATGIIVTAAGAADLPQLRLTGTGTAHEDDKAPAVTALTTAIKTALSQAQISMSDVCALVSDLNGEHAKFKEASIAAIRLDRLPEGGSKTRPLGYYEHWNVVETIGEVGAAVLPAAIGLAFEAGRMGQLGGPHVLFHASEDSGRRDAIIGEFTP